ncbi:MAG: hotdog fold thioesterase [Betaproteobacteria bacterium]|nr:hotdog fold thioesterase [Betaproteobacteria bacterium]
MIWKHPPDLDAINAYRENTLVGHIDINFIEAGADFLRATMPVDARTHQPYGLLHGGASVALAETLGSVASMLCIDPTRNAAVGLEINANHVRGVRSGVVTGTVRPLHIGKSTHVWDIRIENEDAKLVCVSRLTVAVIAALAAR